MQQLFTAYPELLETDFSVWVCPFANFCGIGYFCKVLWIKNSHRCQIEMNLVRTKIIFSFKVFALGSLLCMEQIWYQVRVLRCTFAYALPAPHGAKWCSRLLGVLAFNESGRGLRLLTLMDWKQIGLWVSSTNSCSAARFCVFAANLSQQIRVRMSQGMWSLSLTSRSYS